MLIGDYCVMKIQSYYNENFDIFKEKAHNFSEDYKKFIDKSKTEREFVEIAVDLAKKSGFTEFKFNEKLVPGSKIYTINRDKAISLAVIGSRSILDGINIIVAHIDSPRIDLKPNALYESHGLGYFRTHYYGGIKKYQWTTIPLALHGVVIRQDGTKVNVKIGEDNNDLVFTISDLLPHLAKDQMSKKMSEAIDGEKLNPVIGSLKIESNSQKNKSQNRDEDKDEDKNESESENKNKNKNEKIPSKQVKQAILEILKNKYDISEYDLLTAELQLVPAFKARDVGFDRNLIGAYGQDDRVCSYTALKAILDIDKVPDKTIMCTLVDKEEIGSMGNTGIMSRAFEDSISYIVESVNGSCSHIDVRKIFANSCCLSADVEAALDPLYPEVCEESNAAKINGGVSISKYTGSRGKFSSNDANCEFLHKVCTIFNENGILWRISELGKVDQGGGGTVAQFVANLNIETVDCGIALLSMHSPFEIASKLDIYSAYLAYICFFMQ